MFVLNIRYFFFVLRLKSSEIMMSLMHVKPQLKIPSNYMLMFVRTFRQPQRSTGPKCLFVCFIRLANGCFPSSTRRRISNITINIFEKYSNWSNKTTCKNSIQRSSILSDRSNKINHRFRLGSTTTLSPYVARSRLD